jgi:hypothetical protein
MTFVSRLKVSYASMLKSDARGFWGHDDLPHVCLKGGQYIICQRQYSVTETFSCAIAGQNDAEAHEAGRYSTTCEIVQDIGLAGGKCC